MDHEKYLRPIRRNQQQAYDRIRDRLAVPGFPLDGGRVFRAIMWAINGDLTRSTRIASRAGGIVAWGMMALGIAVSLSTRSWSGLWFVLIGFFLKNASDSAYGQLLLERALEGVFVRDVMRDAPEPVSPATNLNRVVEDRVIGRGERTFFVGGEGSVVGLFTIADLSAIPSDRLASMTAGEIMGILRARNRSAAGQVAPPDGLCLWEVGYPA